MTIEPGRIAPQEEGPHAADVEGLRAGFYAALSRVLTQSPDAEFLSVLAGLDGDVTTLGDAMRAVAGAARKCQQDPDRLQHEYTALFYGMGQGGEVLPYASYYLTGNLHDRPLAALRADMHRLGIARDESSTEPEDHLGLILEIMHGLVAGTLGAPARGDLDQQSAFFAAHIAPWANEFFKDLESAASADFYAAIARFGREFLVVEEDAFALAA